VQNYTYFSELPNFSIGFCLPRCFNLLSDENFTGKLKAPQAWSMLAADDVGCFIVSLLN